jgi:hypothetical protein
MSPAPKGNKNASKPHDEKERLILAYIEHRRQGYSKKSFPPCTYVTIDDYLEEVEFSPLKKDLEEAEREGRKVWEEIGNKIAKGDIKGNPAVWIFTMKNKFGDEWKDKQEVEHSGEAATNINIIVDSSETAETLKRLRDAGSKTD